MEHFFAMKCEDGEIPLLMSEIIQGSNVLEHPSLIQLQPIPEVERCPDLELPVQTRSNSDPNQTLDRTHVLSALAKNASELEHSQTVSQSAGFYKFYIYFLDWT